MRRLILTSWRITASTPELPVGSGTVISAFDVLAGPFGDIAEGPVWDGQALRFTLIHSSLIMRYDPTTGHCSEWASATLKRPIAWRCSDCR